MALGLGVLFRSGAELPAEQRGTQHRQADLDRENREGDQGEQPAVDHHHQDVDHRKGGIEDGGEGLAGEEIADFLQLSHPSAQFPHRTAIEIAERKTQEVINHLGTEPLVDAVGGFSEEEGFEAAQNTLKNGHNHEGDAEHLKRVQTPLADHLVDDHLNQQRVGQGEQLHHEARRQHLYQDPAVSLQGRPEPTWAEFLIRRGVGTLHQEQLDPFGEGFLQSLGIDLDHAGLRRRQLQTALIAGHHQGKTAIPGEHRGNLKTGSGLGGNLRSHHMQAKTGRQLTAQLKVGGQSAADVVLQNFLDGVAPERQLHQLSQHLEAGQGFLKRAISADQSQAVHHIAFGTEAADGRQDLSILNGIRRHQGACRTLVGRRRRWGIAERWESHQPQCEGIARRQILGGGDALTDAQVSPGTGGVDRLARLNCGVDPSCIEGATLRLLQGFLQPFQCRTVGICRRLLENFKKLQQFLGPELLITPGFERNF